MKRIVFCCAVALTLSACNTMDNKASIGRIDPSMLTSQSTGVVIFSTGADHDCYSVSTFLKLFDQSTLQAVKDIPAAPVDAYVSKSDFSDHRGNVSAYPLLPGKYYLSPLTANPYVVGVKVPAFAFEVAGGETVYLGEIYMPHGCSLRTSFKVNDKYERDIALAVAQNPALARRTPVKRLLANHVAGDGSSVDAGLLPISPGIPIKDIFFPPPARPTTAGKATLKDIVPQSLPAAVVAAQTAAPAPAGNYTEKWDGTMHCTARVDGKPGKPYDAKFAMEKRGRDVTVFRRTATFSESLAGRIDGGTLALTGQGAMNDASASWGLRLSGQFSEGASNWTATGETHANGVALRRCTLQLQRT